MDVRLQDMWWVEYQRVKVGYVMGNKYQVGSDFSKKKKKKVGSDFLLFEK